MGYASFAYEMFQYVYTLIILKDKKMHDLFNFLFFK